MLKALLSLQSQATPASTSSVASVGRSRAFLEMLGDAVNIRPLSLSIDHWQSEPDVRSGAVPGHFKGTLTASELTVGGRYVIYRWDGVANAFDMSKAMVVQRFTAKKEIEVMEDPKSFQSDGATYYRCQEDAQQLVV